MFTPTFFLTEGKCASKVVMGMIDVRVGRFEERRALLLHHADDGELVSADRSLPCRSDRARGKSVSAMPEPMTIDLRAGADVAVADEASLADEVVVGDGVVLRHAAERRRAWPAGLCRSRRRAAAVAVNQ